MAKVLVVDESQAFRGVARRILEESDFDVIEARDGLAGLQRGVEDAPDLILIHLDLPGLSGDEICRQFRGFPATQERPLMIWSSTTTSLEHQLALNAGANVFVKRSGAASGLAQIGWGLLHQSGASGREAKPDLCLAVFS